METAIASPLVWVLALTLLIVMTIGLFVFFSLIAPRFNVLTVKKGGQDAEGLPFFVKNSRRIHETVYLETLADVTLTVLETKPAAGAKPATTTPIRVETHTTSISNPQAAAKLAELQAAVATTLSTRYSDQVAVWAAVQDKFNALLPYTVSFPPEGSLPLVLNAIREETYIDYAKPYTINATMPLIGSTDLTTELKDDGTLGKAIIKTEDSTLTTALGTLPIKELMGLLKAEEDKPDTPKPPDAPKPPDGAKPSAASPVYTLQLKVERHTVRHRLSKEVVANGSVAPIELSTAKAGTAWYQRETGSETPPPPPPKKEEEEEEEEAVATG